MVRRVVVAAVMSLLTCTVSCAESGVREKGKEVAGKVKEGGREVGQETKKVAKSAGEGAKATGRAVESGARTTKKATRQISVGSPGITNGK